MRKSGDQLRITAQLVKAEDGYHLWSETYERRLADFFVIQDEIAQAVAKALEITLGVGELGKDPEMTRIVAAYEEYLLAQSALGFTPEEFRERISHLEKAVAIDPEFAEAWHGLYAVYGISSSFIEGGCGPGTGIG